MKKIKLLISLILINFGVNAQHLGETIPSANEFLNFLKENNFKCDFMDREMLYENYGYDAESDISGFLKAINSYCECFIPRYFNEFNLIKSGNDNFIKHLKANGYQDFQFTSLLAFQVFKNIGLIPIKLEQKIYSVDLIKKFKLYGIYAIEVGDTSRPEKEIFRGDKANRESKPWSNLPPPLLYGSSHQIKYSAVQEHDYSKNVDDFNLGDRTVTKVFFDSKGGLTKSIYYELVYENIGGERIWSIVDLKKDVVCEDDPKIEKNSCGECAYKKDVFADINFNTDFDEAIIKFIGDWGEKIKKALVHWDYSFGMYRKGIQVKYAIANAILG